MYKYDEYAAFNNVGLIYVIYVADTQDQNITWCKIGSTNNLRRRLQEHHKSWESYFAVKIDSPIFNIRMLLESVNRVQVEWNIHKEIQNEVFSGSNCLQMSSYSREWYAVAREQFATEYRITFEDQILYWYITKTKYKDFYGAEYFVSGNRALFKSGNYSVVKRVRKTYSQVMTTRDIFEAYHCLHDVLGISRPQIYELQK